MPIKKSISVGDESLNEILKQAQFETKRGLCDVFTARLERLAAHIRQNFLSPHQAAELLEGEAERMQNEQNEAHSS